MEPEGAAPPAPVRPAASRRPGPATEPAYPGPIPLCLRARKNLRFEDFQAGFGVADGVRTERTLASQRAEEFVGGPSMPFGHLRQEQSGVPAQPQDRAVTAHLKLAGGADAAKRSQDG